MGNMRQYLSDLLGEDSADKSHARETLGAAEKYCAHATGTGVPLLPVSILKSRKPFTT